MNLELEIGKFLAHIKFSAQFNRICSVLLPRPKFSKFERPYRPQEHKTQFAVIL